MCTQNVFRSYSAQVLMEKYLKDNDISEILVDSAGTHAYDWERPYSYTFDKLEELGIKPNYGHRNKKISKEIAEDNNYIICMTKKHKDFVENNFGVNAYLFNQISKGELSDLQDDNETTYDDIEIFVKDTVQYIANNIENIYNGLSSKSKEERE